MSTSGRPSRSATRTMSVCVEARFRNDWFECHATPSERTALLTFALSLPREHKGDELEQFRAAVRDEAVEQAREREREALANNNHEALCERLAHVTQEFATQSAASAERLRQSMEAEARANLACLALERRVAELETPALRGRVGEACLSDLLHEAGFDVEDTRTGRKKMEGHLDFLARPRAHPTLRIAVECKNRESLQASDLDSFAQHVRDGIAGNLFDTAILVSWRAPHRRALGIEWLDDDHGHPTIPVSYLAPPRAKVALAEEAVIAHVCLHAALAAGCIPLRDRLDAHDNDATSTLRKLYETTVEELGGVLEDMGRQARLLSELKATVRSVRGRATRLLDQACTCALACDRDPMWLQSMRLVTQRMSDGDRDALLWNRILTPEQRHELTDALGDRDTVLATARSMTKRVRDE